jgi:lipopolysaccharide exporter
MGYQKAAVKGISWVGLMRLTLRVSALVRTAILARLLTPAQFGIFGIASIVLGLVEIFTETGINVFLIQEEESVVKKYLNTAYVVSILRGLIIFLFIIATSPLVVWFFDTPEAMSIILLASLIPLVRGFINPSIINFQKQLKFNQEFLFRTIILIVDSVAAIAITFYYRSPAGLVWGLLMGAVAEVILSHLFLKPKPLFSFELEKFRHIVNRGKWITWAGIFSYLFAKIPDIVIARMLGTQHLGNYQMAYKFAAIPTEEVIETVNRVTFPIFTKFNTDTARLLRALKKNYLAVFTVTLPIIMAIFVFAGPFTQLFLGEEWLAIIPYMKLLSLLALAKIITAPLNPFFLASKHQAYLTYASALMLVTLAVAIIPLTNLLGVLGSIIAIILAFSLAIPYRFYLTRKIITKL